MINSLSKAPPRPMPPISIEVAPSPPPNVTVNPEITVLPAPVTVQPAAESAPPIVIPPHPIAWNLEVVERDDLGLIKRIYARAIINPPTP